MRIGILADIHEDVIRLRGALSHFEDVSADQIVVLGDIFDTGKQFRETVQLLSGAGAIGVFGNHDLGFCHETDEQTLEKYDKLSREYMATLEPQMELNGCLFSHGLPHWDPTDPEIYYIGGMPEEFGVADECFAAIPQRIVFVGHFHRWLAATPDGPLRWKGEEPIQLHEADRFLIVMAAVCDGWCAVWDVLSGQLRPVRIPLDVASSAR